MTVDSDITASGYPIDENGFLVLKFTPAETPGHLKAHLSSSYADDSTLVKNILPMLTIEGKSGAALSPAPQGPDFDVTVPPDGRFSLKINKQKNDLSYTDFALEGSKIMLHGTPHRKLIVAETQMIGRHAQTEFPGPVDYSGILTPIVDQHTHLSAQITGADLIEIGKAHHIYYPTSILDKLDIEYPGNPEHGFKNIPKLKFLPYAKLGDPDEKEERGIMLNNLEKPALRALQNALGLSPESQSTVEDMEKSYFHREPFTKNLDLLPDILRKIAADYKRQGIRYAELSSNAVLDPKWLAKVHEVMSEPDMDPTKDGNTMIRFRPGLPRNLGETAFQERIEKYKRVAASPFVAGPDILGFEMNKTNHMKEHLVTLAKWMHKNQPEDSIQIHAGENSKNLTNVKEAIELALNPKYGIRVLVGHAIYGIDAETLKLARKAARRGKLMVQFNFISNLAGNNIDYPQDVDVSEFFKANIPCFNNSDGAGFYYADAKQTAMMAAQCGVTAENFQAIRHTEEDYIEKQRHIFGDKMAALQRATPETFFKEANAPLPPIAAKSRKPKASRHAGHAEVYTAENMPPLLTESLRGKRPLFFGGSGGSGWRDDMSADQKREFAIGFRMLLEYLDPQKTYFLKGRTKTTGGVGLVMADAIADYNAEPEHKKAVMDSKSDPFALVTVLAQNESAVNHGTPGDFTQMLPTAFVGLPSAIAGELKAKHGAAFCAGGKAFTRNFIAEFHKQGIPLGLMDDLGLVTGDAKPAKANNIYKSASSSKARVYPELAFRGAKNMVKYAFQLDELQDMFVRTPDNEEQLTQLYQRFGRQYDETLKQQALLSLKQNSVSGPGEKPAVPAF